MAVVPRVARDESEKCCRFCLECDHSTEKPLIAPCRCSGSMKYVHRQCLDEWRVQCFNPKALVQCTTCSTPYRLQHKSARGEHRFWKLSLAFDISYFLSLRLLAFFAAACVMGFLPLGIGTVHPNPLVNHVLGGTAYTFAMMGGWGLLSAIWYAPWHGSRFALDLFCPKRLSKDSGNALKGIFLILAIVGLCIALWFILRGLYRMVCEAQQNIVGAVRGANAQARRRIVQEHVVLDLEE